MQCVKANIPITIIEGGTYDKTFRWESGGAVVDLTGYTAKMSVRTKLTSAAAVISIITAVSPWSADGDSGIYIDDPTTGEYRVYVNDADTADILIEHKDTAGVYDLFLYSATSEAVLKQYGKATLLAAVTRT